MSAGLALADPARAAGPAEPAEPLHAGLGPAPAAAIRDLLEACTGIRATLGRPGRLSCLRRWQQHRPGLVIDGSAGGDLASRLPPAPPRFAASTSRTARACPRPSCTTATMWQAPTSSCCLPTHVSSQLRGALRATLAGVARAFHMSRHIRRACRLCLSRGERVYGAGTRRRVRCTPRRGGASAPSAAPATQHAAPSLPPAAAAYSRSSEQYAWLHRDLAAVDRARTPWVIVVFHAPWYNSNYAHQARTAGGRGRGGPAAAACAASAAAPA